MSIETSRECPRCKGAALLLAPMKITDQRNAVYGCKACGYAFKNDGGAYIENAEQLREYFRAGTAANRTLTEALGGRSSTRRPRFCFRRALSNMACRCGSTG